MGNLGAGNKAEAKPPEEREVLPAEPQTHGGGERKEAEGETREEHARMRIQPSPAPFSRHRTSVGHENYQGRSGLPAGLTTADIKPPVASGQRRIVDSEDEVKAGCCKCVIM
jgi:hypothetical protein